MEASNVKARKSSGSKSCTSDFQQAQASIWISTFILCQLLGGNHFGAIGYSGLTVLKADRCAGYTRQLLEHIFNLTSTSFASQPSNL